jgi:hypothetical protein
MLAAIHQHIQRSGGAYGMVWRSVLEHQHASMRLHVLLLATATTTGIVTAPRQCDRRALLLTAAPAGHPAGGDHYDQRPRVP